MVNRHSKTHGQTGGQTAPGQIFGLKDCRDCQTFRNAHCRALADRRTSSDYLRILAGSGLLPDKHWVERLIVAADELDTAAEECRILELELERRNAA